MRYNKSTKESDEQIALFQWAKLHPFINDFLIHIPNGGYRNKAEAAKFKRMGVKAGVSDIFFAQPHAEYHGLWIELKTQKGKLTRSQKEWLKLMQNQGYKAVCCQGWEEAKDILLDYINT